MSARPNPKVHGFEPGGARALSKASGPGSGYAEVRTVNSALVPENHLYAISFAALDAESIRATRYILRDSTAHETVFRSGADLSGEGVGPVGDGLLPVLWSDEVTRVDTLRSRFITGSATNMRVQPQTLSSSTVSLNRRRPGFPDSIRIVFDSVIRDTAIGGGSGFQPRGVKFRAFAMTPQGDRQLDVKLRDRNDVIPFDSTLSAPSEVLDVVTYVGTTAVPTLRLSYDGVRGGGALVKPTLGDEYRINLSIPFSELDTLVFTTGGERIDATLAATQSEAERPYVVPNPYVGSASFEPERFAVSGRGERRIEFRGLPPRAVIRIFNVRGDLVQTLRHDGGTNGYLAWNLRTRDNLDLAPGLYIFHVEASGVSDYVGKFAVVK